MRLAALSRQAVYMAARLSGANVSRLARWLYRYGTIPRTPELERDFGADDEPMAVLGLSGGGRSRRQLSQFYEGATYPGWHSFSLHTAESLDHIRYKLYASPRPEALPVAFPIIAEHFSRMEVRSFKVGRGLDGLLRPDKIVAYFEDRGHLEQVAAEVAGALAGCPVQGVPFTAPCPVNETVADGLLSYGIDPPLGDKAASWRAWITQRLAEQLVKARPASGPIGAEAALCATEAMGIDIRTWAADESLFFKRSA